VVPDVAAPLTRAALLAGRDPAMDAALKWIDEQKGTGSR
jgi:carboxyl-terminal processing protease